MFPLNFLKLLSPSQIACLVLVGCLAGTGFAAKHYYNTSIDLDKQLSVVKKDYDDAVTLNNEQARMFKMQIANQNQSIDQFADSAAKQAKDFEKVNDQVRIMKETAESSINVLRKFDASRLTCIESIDFLVTNSKTLTWGGAR